jgi:hypothetical protein
VVARRLSALAHSVAPWWCASMVAADGAGFSAELRLDAGRGSGGRARWGLVRVQPTGRVGRWPTTGEMVGPT